LQKSLQHFLTGKTRVLQAIVASNLLFSVTHLFISMEFAVITFFAGLFWGWLLYRHDTLAGAVASHVILGVWTVDVVGISAFVAGTA
jgi:hypothetical protein